jgi:hypothetical protein
MNIIYGLIDPVTKQLRYVGQSMRGLKRTSYHMYDYAHGTNEHKRNWINKLKSQGLKYEVEILEELEREEDLNEAEIFWIGYFKMIGCDLLNANAGGASNWHPSEDTLKKMSAWQKGVPKPEEHRAKIAATLTGRPTGRKGLKLYDEKELEQFVKDRNDPFTDQRGIRYESLKECELKTGVPKANIVPVLKGRRKTSHGYIFTYVDESLRPIPKAAPPRDYRNGYSRPEVSKKFKDELGNIYNSLKEASEKLGISISAISNNLNGNVKSKHGHIFEYITS